MSSEVLVPDIYLTSNSSVSSLKFIQSETSEILIAGHSNGEISIYDCVNWKLLQFETKFSNGILMIGGDSLSHIFIQARFEGVKVFQLEPDGGKFKFLELADFYISHEGFCKGFVKDYNSETFLFLPSQGSKLTVNIFKNPFIRPQSTLNPEAVYKDKKYGTLMSCCEYSETEVLTGYENSQLIMWNWRKGEILLSFPLPECGTLMSLTGNSKISHCVAAGSEDKIVVLKIKDTDCEVVKVQEITNPGISVLGIRPDLPILIAGGWDNRIRLFSFKHPHKLKPLAVLDFHSKSVECLTFSSRPPSAGTCKNKMITAVGGKDAKISIWSLYSK